MNLTWVLVLVLVISLFMGTLRFAQTLRRGRSASCAVAPGRQPLSCAARARLSEISAAGVVDNRGGATTIGMDMTASRTGRLYAGRGHLTFTIRIFSKLPYNSEKDLMPVSLIAIVPLVLARSAGCRAVGQG